MIKPNTAYYITEDGICNLVEYSEIDYYNDIDAVAIFSHVDTYNDILVYTPTMIVSLTNIKYQLIHIPSYVCQVYIYSDCVIQIEFEDKSNINYLFCSMNLITNPSEFNDTAYIHLY